MTRTQKRAARALWKRRTAFRLRKERWYRERSKRANKVALHHKWRRLRLDAQRKVAKLDGELTPLRVKALREARKLLGVMEVGGNNRGKRVTEIIRANGGTGPEPWCGDFVAYAYRKAGSKVVQRGWAAVRYLGFLTGQKRVSEPKEGNIVCFEFGHTGLFAYWTDKAKGEFVCIEGNTGATGAVSDSTTGGDGVYAKTRNRSQVTRWVHVTR